MLFAPFFALSWQNNSIAALSKHRHVNAFSLQHRFFVAGD
jgi:hypothetical protein